MRLTLRTLLAHMDDILEANEQEQLAEKIATSEFASDLVHRTRDTMRRLRLSAPQVVGTGLGLDPNTVAEYLDNTLPVENVADLERICLESDIHLAEVGSCHHVLTMVLGESAEIDPATKKRMYGIAEETEQRKQLRIEPAHVPAAVATPTAANPAVPAPAAKPIAQPVSPAPHAEVPDYLRASRRSALRTAVQVVVAAAMLATVAYLGMGFFSSQKDVAIAPSVPSAPTPEPEHPTPVPPKPVIPKTTPPKSVPPESVTPEPTPQEPTKPEPVVPEPASPESVTPGPVTPPSEPPVAPEPTPPELVAPEPITQDPTPPAPVPVVPKEPAPKEMGTFFAEGEAVLLRWDAERSDWFPLPSGALLEVGDQLMSLPTFRPTIALYAGVWAVPTGAALLVLEPSDRDSGVPTAGLRIVYGRVVLINTGKADSAIELTIGSASGTAVVASGAGLAVEVQRKWIPSSDPPPVTYPIEATVYAPMGDVTWNDGAESQTITAPSQWKMLEQGATQIEPMTAAIEWMEEEPASRVQAMAADMIRKRLQPDLSAGTVLLEMGDNRRKEVRAMAAQCSAYVGQFELFVRALNDSDQRQMWAEHIGTMRTAIALNPASADQLLAVLKDLRGGEAGEELFDLICGYSREAIGTAPEEIRTGALEKLINWLENDSLDYRVLAAHNLRAITGKNLMPNPAGSPGDRAQGVRRWRQRLDQDELLPLETYGQ